MVTFTTNKALTLPANSSFVGTWDVPVNGNMSILDSALGGMTTLTLNNGVTVLSTAQSQNAFLTFQSTLTGACTIQFPIGVAGFYTVQNLCTGSSLFTVALTVAGAGGQTICAPPNEPFDVLVDGTNIKYRNFGRVGEYMDYAGSSLPSWISSCTIPPYLYCNGGTFSSATYPVLTNILGSTTLPDARGRARFSYNDGTARIISSGGFGINGDAVGSGGGSQLFVQANLPALTWPSSDTHKHGLGQDTLTTGGGVLKFFVNGPGNSIATSSISAGAINTFSGGSTAPFLPPGYVGGLTLVRAG